MHIHSIFKKPKTNVFIPHLLTFLISNAMNFFIHSLNRFGVEKKMLMRCWISSIKCPIMQLSHMIPGVNIISRKVSVARVNGAWGSGGSLRPQ